MNRLVSHLRANAIAYLALFIAMGGTSYAAISLPANSVGNHQLRNHAIDPDKLNPRYIRGNVRIWASVNADGKVVGGGRGVKVIPPKGVADAGVFTIEPSGRSRISIPRRCAPVVSVDDDSAVPGFAMAELNVASPGESPRWQVVVQTLSAHAAEPMALPFDLAVIC